MTHTLSANGCKAKETQAHCLLLLLFTTGSSAHLPFSTTLTRQWEQQCCEGFKLFIKCKQARSDGSGRQRAGKRKWGRRGPANFLHTSPLHYQLRLLLPRSESQVELWRGTTCNLKSSFPLRGMWKYHLHTHCLWELGIRATAFHRKRQILLYFYYFHHWRARSAYRRLKQEGKHSLHQPRRRKRRARPTQARERRGSSFSSKNKLCFPPLPALL